LIKIAREIRAIFYGRMNDGYEKWKEFIQLFPFYGAALIQ
jgi:hypothetical protein